MSKQRLTPAAEDYGRIGRAIEFIAENHRRQLGLDEMARAVCLSKYHFQRLFKRWVGISPSQFAQFLSLDYARRRLSESADLLGAALDSGLSGPGRLHDLFVTFEAITPGEYKRQAAGVEIRYGVHPTPFGSGLIGLTRRGICHLSFLDGSDAGEPERRLKELWPGATLIGRQEETGPVAAQIFAGSAEWEIPFHLLLRGTNFQVNIWRALLAIPEGALISYSGLARRAGCPKAHRAVASAVASNPIAYLIPCHRVIAKSGIIHKYRWGTVRKKALVAYEAAHREVAGSL